jgi:hypothetical protein
MGSIPVIVTILSILISALQSISNHAVKNNMIVWKYMLPETFTWTYIKKPQNFKAVFPSLILKPSK